MNDLARLPIENIRRRPDARPLDDDALAGLAESIESIGLINPIRVRQMTDGYEVVAGAHRFAACDLLGHREIACIVVEEDDLHAELAMIDENLCRAELSPADRARQTARRKAIYLELHPETEHGANQHTRTGQVVHSNFADATAALTGADARTVRRDAERGEKVIPEVMDMIRDTKLDTGVYLDKLKRLPADQQVAQTKRDLATPPEVRRQDAIDFGDRAAPLERPVGTRMFEAFISKVETIAAIPVDDLIKSAGRQRAVLGQYASSLADRMGEVMEGLSR